MSFIKSKKVRIPNENLIKMLSLKKEGREAPCSPGNSWIPDVFPFPGNRQ